VRCWLEHAQDRKSTIIFCANTKQVSDITEKFRTRYRIDAKPVTNETPSTERTARLNAFKAGEFPILVNCRILTEGADIPNVDCVVFSRCPTNNMGLVRQMIGRGLRLYPGKVDCLVIGMCSKTKRDFLNLPAQLQLKGPHADGIKRLEQPEPIPANTDVMVPRLITKHLHHSDILVPPSPGLSGEAESKTHAQPAENTPTTNNSEPRALPQPQNSGSKAEDTSNSPKSLRSPLPLHLDALFWSSFSVVFCSAVLWFGNMM